MPKKANSFLTADESTHCRCTTTRLSNAVLPTVQMSNNSESNKKRSSPAEASRSTQRAVLIEYTRGQGRKFDCFCLVEALKLERVSFSRAINQKINR